MDDANATASGETGGGSSAVGATDSTKPAAVPGAGEGRPAPLPPEPEARIIEETIVKPAQKMPAPPPTSVVQKSSPPQPPQAPPPLAHDIPPPQNVASDLSMPVPTPQPTPQPPPPPIVARSSPPSAPMLPPPAAASPPQKQSIDLTHTSEEFAKEQQAIAKILKEAKLPEQRTERSAQKPQIIFDTALGAKPTAERPPSPPPPSATSPLPAENTGSPAAAPKQNGLASTIVAPLRTLKDDLQSVVRRKKISLVRAVALEEEKRQHPSEDERVKEEITVRKTRRTSRVLFTAGLFIAIGTAAFFGVFLVMGERSRAPSKIPQSDILFAESGVPLPLEGSALELKRMLANARLSGSGTLGSITRIVPTVAETLPKGDVIDRPATLQEFLRALGTRVPDELLRALSQNFFFGLHTVDENAPLLVIPVGSYERAFAGMLAWEERLNADLAPVFTRVPDQVIGSGGLPEKRRFEDVVMRNYDVRVLKDDSGTMQLYYSFPTRSLLVIAESPYSFTEILSRLRAERKL